MPPSFCSLLRKGTQASSFAATARANYRFMAMTVTKIHFNHRIDRWDARGETIIDHIGGHDDVQVATAAYTAACNRWPGDPITLRQGTVAIEGSRPDPHEPARRTEFSGESHLRSDVQTDRGLWTVVWAATIVAVLMGVGAAMFFAIDFSDQR